MHDVPVKVAKTKTVDRKTAVREKLKLYESAKSSYNKANEKLNGTETLSDADKSKYNKQLENAEQEMQQHKEQILTTMKELNEDAKNYYDENGVVKEDYKDDAWDIRSLSRTVTLTTGDLSKEELGLIKAEELFDKEGLDSFKNKLEQLAANGELSVEKFPKPSPA